MLKENARLKRLLARKEREINMLIGLNHHASRLCDIYEKEKNIQLIYNKLLLRHIPSMIYVLDRELRLVLCSNSGSSLTLGESDKLLHKPFFTILSPKVDQDWAAKIHRQCLHTLETRAVLQYDDLIFIDGAKTVFVHTSLMPVADENGDPQGVIILLHNITELIEGKRRAEEGARAKSAFLANMSHEIRTPLNSIKGFSEILFATKLEERQRLYLNHVLSATTSLTAIVDDVLDFSKIDAGKMEILALPYSLRRLISDVCGVTTVRAAEKGLTFLTDISPDLPADLIGDEAHLRQIIVNLLSNAVKYTPSGQVKLTLRQEAAETRLFLIVEVEDSGRGIRPDDMPHIFDTFTRLDPKATRHISGTGLGLPISRRLARAMDGEITVRSSYGDGSAFTLKLPQEPAPDSRPLCRLNDSWRGRVLLLGDDARLDNAHAMCETLRAPFHRLRSLPAETGQLALEALKTAISATQTEAGVFTHVIHTEGLTEGLLGELRGGLLSGCRFCELHSLRTSLAPSSRPGKTTLLFNPLLITDLADFLQADPEAEYGSPAAPLPAPALTTREVLALAVDDHELNLLVCEEFLREYGIEVVRASSGEEALRLCREIKFDLIFLDHMMPNMDGLEVARCLRESGGLNWKTPRVALTANVANNMRDYYLKSGFDDMIGKPIDKSALTLTLLKLLPPEKIA